ncbi:ATP-binding protein [Pseudoalteromonas byunsanensis]|uniref:ATP-binding protein n=1 Tax=Pseudoalteromonas byunsanensis TaxID=327939 RepID=A0A1S1N3F7_9GAMM|nr:ATP-binding protein [Pseudoalteromonas byunsanensis]OHU93938.1 hypothetical protein BIW53_17080 [Pseudoalteromonas byunsanensis]
MSRDEKRAGKPFKVDVSPEMRIYKILQHLNYNLETAFAELIDNSIQSFLDKKADIEKYYGESSPKLKVTVDISTAKNQIVIKDNAGGILGDDMDRALRLGVDLGTVHSADSLSVYGIGMKSSAIWFSDNWSIRTSAIGVDEKLDFSFNLDELLENNQTDAEVVPSEAGVNEHYTEIVLRNHIRNETADHYQDTIIPFIEETFHKFSNFTTIEFYYDDVLLKPNSKNLETSVPNILEYPRVNGQGLIDSKVLIKWLLELDFIYEGRKVHGFVSIRKKGKYGQPGIRLLRNNRVIEGTSISPNYPDSLLKSKNKFTAQRIYGELHLDSFPVDFMKTNFNENLKGLYEEIHKRISKEYWVNLIYQADKLRVRNLPKKEKELLQEAEKLKPAVNINMLEEEMLNGGPSKPKLEEGTGPATEMPNKPTTNEPISTNLEGEQESQSPPKSEAEGNGSKNSEASGTPFPFEVKEENKIEFSNELNKYLAQLDGNKACHLYDSLCRLSLKQHSVLMYIGAWSFLEMLTALVGRNTQASFEDFLGTKINEYTKDKKVKSELKKVVGDISTRGNCTKHSGIFWNYTAMDLKPAFIILEPFIIYLIEKHKEKMKLAEASV